MFFVTLKILLTTRSFQMINMLLHSHHHPHRLSHEFRHIHRSHTQSSLRILRFILQIQSTHITPIDATC
jgi:hypothetical protein